MSEPKRVDFKSKGGSGLKIVVVAILAGLGFGVTRVIAASVELGDFWTIGVMACIVLALLVWGAVAVLMSIAAPFLIITPDDIRQPGTFKTIRHEIGPQTRVGRYTIEGRIYTQETTTTARKPVTSTRYILKNGDGPLVHLASMAPDNPQVKAISKALEDVGGVSVEELSVLPKDVARNTPARPDVRHWG